MIDHTFCVDLDSFGEVKSHELKPGGADIAVTEETKKEYVRSVNNNIMWMNWGKESFKSQNAWFDNVNSERTKCKFPKSKTEFLKTLV